MKCAVPELLTHPAPIDGQAAKELRHWSSVRPQKRPLTLCRVSPRDVGKRNGGLKDMTGFRYGDMTVVGLVRYEEAGQSVWSVKCWCGNYETRPHALLEAVLCSPKRRRSLMDDACSSCMTPEREAARKLLMSRTFRQRFSRQTHDEENT